MQAFSKSNENRSNSIREEYPNYQFPKACKLEVVNQKSYHIKSSR